MKKGLVTNILFLSIVFGFTIAGILLPDRDFSANENRYLAAFPTFSWKRLASGAFMEDFETYLTDQFPLRDSCVQANTAILYAEGLREKDGVYFANGADGGWKSDGLLQRFSVWEEKRIASNTQAVRDFVAQSEVPVSFLLIPGAGSVQSERLPKGAPQADEAALISAQYAAAGGGVDVDTRLRAHHDEPLYYRTDHHWTTRGAYYGYAAVLESMGLVPLPLETYAATTVSSAFYGTLHAKAPAFWIQPDEIIRYVPDDGVSVTRISGDEREETKLYAEDRLDVRDKYAYFLGGNSPLVIIRTKSAHEQKLLVIRDSYFDSAAPFYTPHFSEIHLLDPRYYRMPVSAYIREHGIDAVLIEYSLSIYAADVNLPLVLK